MTKKKKIKVAALADIHIRETDSGKWSKIFRSASENADLLIIAGDLTDTGNLSEAEILIQELQSCTIPVIGVLGNHDHEAQQQRKLMKKLADHITILDGTHMVFEHVGIAGIKGFGGGFDKGMLSTFGEKHYKDFVQETVNESLKLDRALSRLEAENPEAKKLVIMHYSPICETVKGEPEQIYPFLGCSRLAEPLNRREVMAVFHGHSHIGTFHGNTSEGVAVYNVSTPVLKAEGYEQGYFIYEV